MLGWLLVENTFERCSFFSWRRVHVAGSFTDTTGHGGSEG